MNDETETGETVRVNSLTKVTVAGFSFVVNAGMLKSYQ
jgi:hypothetical protein